MEDNIKKYDLGFCFFGVILCSFTAVIIRDTAPQRIVIAFFVLAVAFAALLAYSVHKNLRFYHGK